MWIKYLVFMPGSLMALCLINALPFPHYQLTCTVSIFLAATLKHRPLAMCDYCTWWAHFLADQLWQLWDCNTYHRIKFDYLQYRNYWNTGSNTFPHPNTSQITCCSMDTWGISRWLTSLSSSSMYRLVWYIFYFLNIPHHWIYKFQKWNLATETCLQKVH